MLGVQKVGYYPNHPKVDRSFAQPNAPSLSCKGRFTRAFAALQADSASGAARANTGTCKQERGSLPHSLIELPVIRDLIP